MSAASIRLRNRTTALGLQRGVAAIEFAFVFIFLFLVMYGLVSFGAIFYTQQAVSRAAEDGARAAMLLPQPPDQESVRQVVFDSLARSLVVPTSFNADTTSRKNWLSDNVTIAPCSAVPGATSCVVTVTYLYKNNRILPSVSLLDTSWVPDQLQGSATAALKTS